MTREGVRTCTDAELLLLGLLAEMPRHGYELEQEIERRGLREWTQIGFSSIYFVLAKLRRARLVAARRAARARSRKTFVLTDAGRRLLVAQTLTALGTYRPTYGSLLLGMIHWPVLTRKQALTALQGRGIAVDAELARLETMHANQQPLPDYVDAVFDFTMAQLKAEAEWIRRTFDYMKTKPVA